MSDASAWLSTRRPAPPVDLAEALRVETASGSLTDVLAVEGAARLAAARTRLGRVRESAFRLLEADALFTYACEAALDLDDPETALARILASTV